jgi:hypothetical protein
MKQQLSTKVWGAVMCVAALLVLGNTASSVCAQSIVPNYSFELETSGEPNDWFKGGSWAYITNDGSDGNASAALTGSGDWRSLGFALNQGQTYEFSVDYKVLSGSSGSIRADFRFFDFAGPSGTFGSFQGEFVAPIADVSLETPDVWQTLGPFTVTAPVTGQPTLFGDVRISAGLFGDPFSGEIRFDRVIVTPEPSSLLLLSASALGLLGFRRRR